MSVRFASRSVLGTLAVAMLLALPSLGFAQASPSAVPGAPVLQGGVAGQTAILNWTAVPGATSYEVGVGVQSNQYLLVQNVGATTAVAVPAPPGVFFVRVRGRNGEGAGLPSNEIALAVGAPPTVPPPVAPVNLQASVSNQVVNLSWQPGVGGGPATALVFAVGTAPGASNLGLFPLNLSLQASRAVPPGAYYARLHVLGPGGASGPSNEVFVNVGGGACGVTPPSVSANVNGAFVALSWTPVPGVVGYRLEVAATPGGPAALSQIFPPNVTSFSTGGVPPGVYYVRVTTATPCGTLVTGPEAQVAVSSPPPGSRPRTPDPPPGQILPLPNRSAVVDQMAAQLRGDFNNSCREHGGNNTWLFRLVERLRQEDTRWGLNWKRARIGDMSQDVVTYHYGPGPDESSFDVYVIDVIGNHCGTTPPNPAWNDVTILGTTGARFTLQPYIQAGYQP